MPPKLAFSDYIIYADESGSPVLSADHEDYPLFVLVFLIVRKAYYATTLVPQIQMLKFDFVGHD
jgi:type II secretory pathway component PulF